MDSNKRNFAPLSFFRSWSGLPDSHGHQQGFVEARGSRLTPEQRKMLVESGVPVVRLKGTLDLKVFVPGPGESFFSTVMPRYDLLRLAKDLSVYSVEFSQTDKSTYGLE